MKNSDWGEDVEGFRSTIVTADIAQNNSWRFLNPNGILSNKFNEFIIAYLNFLTLNLSILLEPYYNSCYAGYEAPNLR